MSPAQRASVVSHARSWVGTPYHHHARLKGVGVDCAQLLCAVYEAAGVVPHVETGTYPHDWHLHRSLEMFSGWLEKFGARLPADAPLQPADVVLFRYGRTFSHGAIVLEDDLLIHSYLGSGVILTRLHEAPLGDRAFERWGIA